MSRVKFPEVREKSFARYW